MDQRALMIELDLIDDQLRDALKLAKSDKATTLKQAVLKSAATTEEVLFGVGGQETASMPPQIQHLLVESLQAQVKARLTCCGDSDEPVRSAMDGFRRMKIASSLRSLERQLCIELCATAGFDNALLSSITPDGFVPATSDRPAATGSQIRRGLCVAEQDAVRLRRIVRAGRRGVPATGSYRELLGTSDYLVAPVMADSKVLALIHVCRAGEDTTARDVDLLEMFSWIYSLIRERVLNAERVENLRISITDAAAHLADEADRIAGSAIGLNAEYSDSGGAARAASDVFAGTLSDRERRVFERLVRGDSNAKIAQEFVISVETVKTHVKRILRKIGAVNRLEAITLYVDAQARFGQQGR